MLVIYGYELWLKIKDTAEPRYFVFLEENTPIFQYNKKLLWKGQFLCHKLNVASPNIIDNFTTLESGFDCS